MGKTAPNEGYWALVDPYWDVVNIYAGDRVFSSTFARVPLASGLLLAAHWCQSEVCNGGFEQFFENSTGVLAPEAVAAFRAIGRGDLADLLATAMTYFGKRYPRSRRQRQALLGSSAHARRWLVRQLPPIRRSEDEEETSFDRLDEAFYRCLKRKTFEASADRFANEARSKALEPQPRAAKRRTKLSSSKRSTRKNGR